MRVVTWNLWWRYGPWQQRQPAIAAALAELQPDVCGFQEVWGGPDENLAAELAEPLGMHWCWAEAAKARHAVCACAMIGQRLRMALPMNRLAPPAWRAFAASAQHQCMPSGSASSAARFSSGPPQTS